jgi:HSP20 family molecular chaperone IbpA
MANQSQTAATRAKETTSSPIPIHRDNQQLQDRLNKEISRRAYSLYEQDGTPDQDLANWLTAESQILQRIPEIRESSSWYTINVPLQGFAAEEVQVIVEPARGVIAADHKQQAGGRATTAEQTSADGSTSLRESVYLVAAWPTEVDPATASAYLKNDSLTLTVKRANPIPQKSTAE